MTHAGDSIARAIGKTVPVIPFKAPRAAEETNDPDAASVDTEPLPFELGAAEQGVPILGRRRLASAEKENKEPADAGEKTIFVPAAVVRRLGARGRPPISASPVRDPKGRTGLLLNGVESLGIGLRNGDVLVSVEGRAASSEADVLSIVSARLQAGARVITGRIVRNGEPMGLVVEVPPEVFADAGKPNPF